MNWVGRTRCGTFCGGLASCEGKLSHLGITDNAAPKRTTLAYAHGQRPWQLFEQVFYALLARCQAVAGPKKFRFKNKLVSLDATIIDLCAEVFEWAARRRAKGAVKLHFTLDHDGYLPTLLVITEGKRHEMTVAKQLMFPAGTILVFDRAYIDYRWLARLDAAGVFFVTRAKADMDYAVIEAQPVPERGGITAEDWIALRGVKTEEKYVPGRPLRRVVLRVADRDAPLIFLTNHLRLGATAVARIYKDRWQIELFFKALKQHLRVKTFVGTSATALHIQIWTALIALLLLKYLQLKARFGWSFANLVALLRMNLFVYRDLWAWIDEPFTRPPDLPEAVQRTLAWA